MNKRPKLFIGSSSEGRQIAQIAFELLDDNNIHASLWDHDLFSLSTSAIDSLMNATRSFDFALLIATADDLVISRGNEVASPRDNIVFEIGLFMGALGVQNTFFMHPKRQPPKLPSDLFGLMSAQFDETRYQTDPKAALAKPCGVIQRQIAQTFQLKRGISSNRVAAVCIDKSQPDKLLLVRTTGGRWTFPRGRLLFDEEPENAALRLAKFKGGVASAKVVRYLMDYEDFGPQSDAPVSAFLLEVREENSDLAERFREPKWIVRAETTKLLALGRSPSSTQSMIAIIEDALG
jgi:ADP-ribose pyrophosphatase YjhB (NUDIX family)